MNVFSLRRFSKRHDRVASVHTSFPVWTSETLRYWRGFQANKYNINLFKHKPTSKFCVKTFIVH